MSKRNPIEATQHIAAVLRQCASPLVEVIGDGLGVWEHPRPIRERIVDELGRHFRPRGSRPTR
jgi:hypothetical protein